MIISLQNKPLGQINLGTERGQIIKDLASMPTVRTIVEIGTWNGYGSTQCVLEGIKDKKDCEFSTRAEWEILRDRTKFVFLDDTEALKNIANREELLESGEFDLIKDVRAPSPHDPVQEYHHGWSVFLRKDK